MIQTIFGTCKLAYSGFAYFCLSFVCSVSVNPHYNTPAPVPDVEVGQSENHDGSRFKFGSITNLVLVIAVIFCVFVIVLSISCTHWAGWKRQKYMHAEIREDSGLTAGFRSSASGHSIERSARGIAQSGSSASELSNYSNNKRGCPDGRYFDRSSLYMVKDETGVTYLPESNLSSPSHADLEGSKQLVTIPEDRDLPSSPYQDGEDRDAEDLTKYEVGLPYHLGPGSVGELSDRQTVRSDINAKDLSTRSLDKHGSRSTIDKHSSRSGHSHRGSQNSMVGSQTTGISSRSHRSGSGSVSRFDNSDSSVSRRHHHHHRRSLNSPMSPEEGDFRVLTGSEDPDFGRGARRKRKSSPSGGSHNSHSSHRSHGSHHGKGHHRSQSSDGKDHKSGKRRHKHDSHPDLNQRPGAIGESPTTQGPINLYRHSYHGQQDSNIPSPVVEYPHDGSPSRHKSRHRSKTSEVPDTPTPTNEYSNTIYDLAYTTTSANLGPRAPIWPGKSPSTEGTSPASDTNSRESSRQSQNSSSQNRIETTADIEHVDRSPSSDGKQKKQSKHKKDRHKRKSKSGRRSSGSAEDDPKTASRLAHHSNGYLDEQDKSDVQSESAQSTPSVASPLHYSYLNSKQRTDYMKSVFISDESLAKTHSSENSARSSRTATPNMSHRKMPSTPPSGVSSGRSSPTKSLTCVPIYSDIDGDPASTPSPPSAVPLADTESFELDDLTSPEMTSPVSDNQKRLSTGTSTGLYKKFEKQEKGETEKGEIVKTDANVKQENQVNGTNGFNGTRPLIVGRRTRPPRGPLSAASLV